MVLLWDYDEKDLKKNRDGRLILLERLINFGPKGREKIKLTDVKKYWNNLHLFAPQKRLLELLIWKSHKYLPKSKKSFWMK